MPSRRLFMAIVFLWVFMIGWQLYRQFGQIYDSAPKLLDALEEAAKDCDAAKEKYRDDQIHWTIRLNQQRLGSVSNRVTRDKNLMFSLRQKVVLDGDLNEFLNLKQNLPLVKTVLGIDLASLSLEMITDMDVNYFGSLVRITLNASISTGKGRDKSELGNLTVNAQALEQALLLRGRLKAGSQVLPLPPNYQVKYDPKNMVFNSICPVDVMPNLRPGQTWEAPMLDLQSLLDFNNFLNPSKELTPPDRKPVPVRVLHEVRNLSWGGQEVPCLLVSADQLRGLKVTIWVRQADGRVLMQVAEWGNRRIEIVRDVR
jgi:hypothetical protein